MTVVSESLTAPEQSCPSFELDSLSMLADPNDQLKVLSDQFAAQVGYIPYRVVTPEQEVSYAPLAQELVDFAINSDTTPSLTVRLYALEKALSLGYGSDFCNLLGGSENGYLAYTVTYPINNGNQKEERRTREWRYLFGNLMNDEGIDSTFFWPEPHETKHLDYETFTDNHPSRALVFLDRVIDANYKTDLPDESRAVIDTFMPLVQGLQDVMTRTLEISDLDTLQPIDSWRTISYVLGLSKYSKNTHQEIVTFFNSRDMLSREHYNVIEDLAASSASLSHQFPKEYQLGAREGFRHLIADSIYALLEHQKNNELSHVQLPLKNSDSELPLTLVGDEPLQLLKALAKSCDDIVTHNNHVYFTHGEEHTPADVWKNFALVAVDQPEFKIFRLISATGGMNTSVYIRPRGGERYDARLEYGRNGEGVEASISYVVDPFLPKGELLEVGKHKGSQPDNRISIRLDREGVSPEQRNIAGTKHDPTQEAGTVSLDIGSVIGDEAWLGTRIGRFLAWGNLLCTTLHGDISQLNHMTTYFDGEHGSAAHFEEGAQALIEMYRKRSVSQGEIRKIMPAILNGELVRW